MKFGINFHTGSKADAVTRLNGAVSLPARVRELAIATVNALAGEPSIVKLSIGGEHKGNEISAIVVSVSGNG
jgi:hypothetical protein